MPVNPVVAPLSLGNGVQVSSANLPTNVATNKPTLTKISAVDVCDEEGDNFLSINIFNDFMFAFYFFQPKSCLVGYPVQQKMLV
jgi:hypothetical protein